MTGTRAAKGSVVVRQLPDGVWEGCVERGPHPRTGRRWRARIRRKERQEAVYLTLKYRAKAYRFRRGPEVDRKPSTAAEWFWLWLWNERNRKRARVYAAHWEPFQQHVMPGLDDRSLDDVDAAEVARLLNRVPTWSGKDAAHRVLTASLETARERGWVNQNAALSVSTVAALAAQLDATDDDDDRFFDPIDDPGCAIVHDA